ncbi:AraC family transcriptional regulator [Puniceicoccus vermicola]|uniref:AraC family transcriptional regulator n=1 Tax=Puniceicoccus vermicola TaxID=388746 RepID=A0A7X1E2F2_9BACT|nr:AraC family transcriptional regulator [Puniceicoccus vermicola]MBC2600410.1 AraC family transcriptional regulator [Puniceicoccus vermicola]
MKTILWRQICPNEEHLHVATIELKRMRAPAMHRHDFYECFLVLDGNGTHKLPEGETPLRGHTLYFLRPEHAHAIYGLKNLVFLNLAFRASTFEKVFSLAEFTPGLWREGDPVQSVELDEQQVEDFTQWVAQVAGDRSARNASWLLLSLARLLQPRQSTTLQRPNMPDWMADGLSRATESDVVTEGLPALTRIMGRSREHIARSFQQHLGQTPTEWINQERIERACLLLATTRLSVYEIALDCGFESASYFHKCFRQARGTTPRDYRTNLMRIQR